VAIFASDGRPLTVDDSPLCESEGHSSSQVDRLTLATEPIHVRVAIRVSDQSATLDRIQCDRVCHRRIFFDDSDWKRKRLLVLGIGLGFHSIGWRSTRTVPRNSLATFLGNDSLSPINRIWVDCSSCDKGTFDATVHSARPRDGTKRYP
jgi:hypothetical protein